MHVHTVSEGRKETNKGRDSGTLDRIGLYLKKKDINS
jgi:hypothetical protein